MQNGDQSVLLNLTHRFLNFIKKPEKRYKSNGPTISLFDFGL